MNKKKWIRLAIMVGVVLVAYFVNVELQTHWGEKAREARGFEALPLDEALVAARASGKPVLAVLSAVWCPSCRKLDQRVLGDARVSATIREQYVFAGIEYESEEGEAFMSRYGVRGFPNLLILDGQGELVRKLDLTFEPERFLANIER